MISSEHNMGQPQPSTQSGSSKQNTKYNVRNNTKGGLKGLIKPNLSHSQHFKQNEAMHSHELGQSNVGCHYCKFYTQEVSEFVYDPETDSFTISFMKKRQHKPVQETHSITSKQRNKNQHSLNGNVRGNGKNKKGVKKQHPKAKTRAQMPRKARMKGPIQPVGPTPNKNRNKLTGRIGLSMNQAGATTRREQVICEDEYIGEVSGSVSFATNSYAVNPGQASVFPWGNKIASLYEEYDFEYLEFYYKREVSEFATNGQAGKVILSFDYDASDIAPTSKQQVEDTVPRKDGMPCTPIISLKIDCARIRKNSSKYVRPGAQPNNTDIKTYDAGNLYVSTQGNTNTSVIGELRVKYCVKLSEPVLESASLSAGNVAHFSSLVGTTANNLAGMTIQTGSTLTGVTVAGNAITFPAGQAGNYLCFIAIQAATSVGAFGFGSVTGGVSLLNLLSSANTRDNNSGIASVGGTTTFGTMIMFTVNVTALGGTLIISPSTIVTSGTTAGDVWVIALPSTILTADEEEQVEIDELKVRADEQDRKIEKLMALLTPIPSSPSLPLDDCKEDDLEQSVHLSRTMASRIGLALGVSMKK